MSAAVETLRPARSRVWWPPEYVWPLVGVLALLAIQRVSPKHLEGHWIVATPIAVAIAVLALRWLWRQPPAGAFCAAMVLTCFSSGWENMGLKGLPLNRALFVLVILQFLLRAPGTASVPRVQVRNVHLLMGLTILYALASSAASGFLGNKLAMLNLTDLLGVFPFTAFLLAPSVFHGRRERNLLLAVMVGFGFYLGVTAIFETIGPKALVYPHYIVRTDVAAVGLVEVSGPFQSPVAEGFATFACATACAIALFQWRARRWQALAVVTGILCLFACFATLERAVWLGAVAGIVVVALLSRRGRRLLVPGAILTVLGLALVLTFSSQLSNNTHERAGSEKSVWDRKNQNAAGLRMVGAKPLFGFGWNRFETDNLPYFRQAADYPMSGQAGGVAIGEKHELLPLHDTYLAYAVELGLVGLTLWLLSLGSAIVSAILRPGDRSLVPWKLGLIGIAVFFAIVSAFDPHEQPYPIILLMLWAGVAYGAPGSIASRRDAAA